jgi:Mrp family chromosome partitioning ATPase
VVALVLATALAYGAAAFFIRKYTDPVLVAPPLLGVAMGLVLSAFLLWRGGRQGLRSENELISVLGAPLLAARPLTPGFSHQLLAHWFSRGRPLLAVVSATSGDGRTRVAAELADFLEGRSVRLAHCADNLSVLVAGRSSADPLELLSRSRLQHLLAAAAKRYRVVLVDTPAAARGPDLQMFAAFAGGALVVTQHPAQAPALQRLRDLLACCKARVVGTVLSPA